jgi:hypothetical protein
VADNMTDTAENLALDWINVVGTPARPTSPLKLALLTVAGSDSAAGTEVTDAGGSAYLRQTATLAAASGGATSNTNLISFTNMPSCTVVAVAIYDSAGSPVRLWHGALTASKTVNLGDTFQIAIGDLDLAIG